MSGQAATPDEGGSDASVVAGVRGSGCIRGGSTREEVVEIMGPPDSVAFGAYVYGRSQVLFGYGVVVDWSNDGDDLRLC